MPVFDYLYRNLYVWYFFYVICTCSTCSNNKCNCSIMFLNLYQILKTFHSQFFTWIFSKQLILVYNLNKLFLTAVNYMQQTIIILLYFLVPSLVVEVRVHQCTFNFTLFSRQSLYNSCIWQLSIIIFHRRCSYFTFLTSYVQKRFWNTVIKAIISIYISFLFVIMSHICCIQTPRCLISIILHESYLTPLVADPFL